VLRLVCAIRSSNATVARLVSYSTPDSENLGPIKIWQAARATSAAPGFFPPITIGMWDYVDGALGANNPSNEILDAAASIWAGGEIEDQIECFVSIGFGIQIGSKISARFLDISKALVSISTETERTAKSVLPVDGHPPILASI